MHLISLIYQLLLDHILKPVVVLSLVSLFEKTASEIGCPIQRSAHSGALTDLSYVQHVGKGVAAIDLGFPMRYSHSSREVCDLNDLVQLAQLLIGAIDRIDKNFSLHRNS